VLVPGDIDDSGRLRTSRQREIPSVDNLDWADTFTSSNQTGLPTRVLGDCGDLGSGLTNRVTDGL